MDVVDVKVNILVLFHHKGGVVDMPDAALGEDVDFFEAEVFGGVHVPLHCWESFWGEVERGVCADGFLRNEYPSGVDASEVWEVRHLLGQSGQLANWPITGSLGLKQRGLSASWSISAFGSPATLPSSRTMALSRKVEMVPSRAVCWCP